MPHVGIRGGKPIHERSGRELIIMFVIVPWIIGPALLIVTVVNLSSSSTWRDWLAVVWAVALSIGLMLGLPAAAWQEWQRRKQFRTLEDVSMQRHD